MLSNRASRRRTLVLAAALLACLGTARLGFWQLDRAQQKLELQSRLQLRAAQPALSAAELPADLAAAQRQYDRPLQLRGRWLTEHTLYLDNRQMNARQGFFVLTPLLLGNGDAVLVQRGWMPRDFIDRSRLKPLPPQPGDLLVSGRLSPPPSRLLALSDAEQGPIRQNIDLTAYAREIGVTLRPWSLQQTAPAQALAEAGAPPPPAAADDGLLRQWPQVALDVAKHQGYAFQWFALSALVLGLTVWFQFLRPRRPPSNPSSTPIA